MVSLQQLFKNLFGLDKSHRKYQLICTLYIHGFALSGMAWVADWLSMDISTELNYCSTISAFDNLIQPCAMFLKLMMKSEMNCERESVFVGGKSNG